MGEDGMAKTRIHVGGLGETVTGDDLRKVFSSLGMVDGLEIVRTKGRSFAYVDFVPSFVNSLSKLFSTYNGCVWKGGRLRLEKANENYLARLRREWEEDFQLASNPLRDVDAADKIVATSEKPPKDKNLEKAQKDKNLETKQLRLFFPRLRKVKSLPLTGTGKHKYSFQRVEAPALPLHFCDCEEHAGPSHTVGKRQIHNQEEKDGAINEEEINIMNSVMNKLFERENVSTVSGRTMSKEENNGIRSTDSLPFEEKESDEDNLIINVVSRENNKVALSGRNEEKRLSIKKTQFSGIQASKEESICSVQKLQKKNGLPAKKMKRLLGEGGKDEVVTVVPGGIENSQYDESRADFQENEVESETDEDNLIINVVSRGNKSMTSSGSREQEMISIQELRTSALQKSEEGRIKDALKAQKRSDLPSNKKRKSLLNEGMGGSEPGSDGPVEKGNSKTHSNGSGTHSVAQPAGPESGTKQSSAGYSWSQKSSWRSLVGGTGKSSFSLSNILPNVDPIEEEKPVSDDPKVDNNSHNKDEMVAASVPMSDDPEVDNDSHNKNEMVAASVLVSDDPKVDNNSHNKNEMVAASENLEGMSGKTDEDYMVVEPQPTKPSEAPSKSGRGSYWLHRSSWMQLVNENNSSFSILDILPGTTSAKEALVQPNSDDVVTFPNRNHDSGMKPSDNETNGNVAIDLKIGKEEGSVQSISEKNQETIRDNGDGSAPVIEKKGGSAAKKAVSVDANIGETCSFMRSAASLKEWANTKAALSGSRKKKGNVK